LKDVAKEYNVSKVAYEYSTSFITMMILLYTIDKGFFMGFFMD